MSMQAIRPAGTPPADMFPKESRNPARRQCKGTAYISSNTKRYCHRSCNTHECAGTKRIYYSFRPAASFYQRQAHIHGRDPRHAGRFQIPYFFRYYRYRHQTEGFPYDIMHERHGSCHGKSGFCQYAGNKGLPSESGADSNGFLYRQPIICEQGHYQAVCRSHDKASSHCRHRHEKDPKPCTLKPLKYIA